MQGVHCRNLEITFKTCYKYQHRQQQQQPKQDLFSSYNCQQYLESAKINVGSLHLQLVFKELIALLLNLKNSKESASTIAQRKMWLQGRLEHEKSIECTLLQKRSIAVLADIRTEQSLFNSNIKWE